MSKRDLEFLDKSIATAYSDSCSYITKGEAGAVCVHIGEEVGGWEAKGGGRKVTMQVWETEKGWKR